jgi:hypothetical protein
MQETRSPPAGGLQSGSREVSVAIPQDVGQPRVGYWVFVICLLVVGYILDWAYPGREDHVTLDLQVTGHLGGAIARSLAPAVIGIFTFRAGARMPDLLSKTTIPVLVFALGAMALAVESLDPRLFEKPTNAGDTLILHQGVTGFAVAVAMLVSALSVAQFVERIRPRRSDLARLSD